MMRKTTGGNVVLMSERHRCPKAQPMADEHPPVLILDPGRPRLKVCVFEQSNLSGITARMLIN